MSAPTDSGTVLDRILHARRLEVGHRKRVLPEAALRYGVNAATPLRDFSAALTRDSLNVIAELKPASPAKGILRDPFNPVELARSFEAAGAVVLSVLTESEFFRGSLKNLRDARNAVKLPVLRKDFIFDPWQVWETRANDADSFLLIVAALTDNQLAALLALGRELKMEPLVEVHTPAELDRALHAGAKTIGVNNRNLKTLEVRIETSFELIEKIPDDCIAISESGIASHAEIEKLRAAGFDAFLIGTSLMLAPTPPPPFLLYWENKWQRSSKSAASLARRTHASPKNSEPGPSASISTKNRLAPFLPPTPGTFGANWLRPPKPSASSSTGCRKSSCILSTHSNWTPSSFTGTKRRSSSTISRTISPSSKLFASALVFPRPRSGNSAAR